jgi:hypothetical protein
MSSLLGKLHGDALREVWEDEAHIFMLWLENKIEIASFMLLELRFCLSQRTERDYHDATA